MQSPEVIAHLQMLQDNVTYKKQMNSIAEVKAEAKVPQSATVKTEKPQSKPSTPISTLGQVTMLNIKQEGDDNDLDTSVEEKQTETRSVIEPESRETTQDACSSDSVNGPSVSEIARDR